MPVEIMHLPLWFPFHLSKVSYWFAHGDCPAAVLMAAAAPGRETPVASSIQELFRTTAGASVRLDSRTVPLSLGPVLQGRRCRAAHGRTNVPEEPVAEPPSARRSLS